MWKVCGFRPQRYGLKQGNYFSVIARVFLLSFKALYEGPLIIPQQEKAEVFHLQELNPCWFSFDFLNIILAHSMLP